MRETSGPAARSGDEGCAKENSKDGNAHTNEIELKNKNGSQQNFANDFNSERISLYSRAHISILSDVQG